MGFLGGVPLLMKIADGTLCFACVIHVDP